MSAIAQLPPVQLAHAISLFLGGRVHFLSDSIEQADHQNGNDFVPYRKIVLAPTVEQPQEAGAIFDVRFRFARFSIATNKYLSLIPIPFILAQPGFRSKTWMLDENTGTFRGLYEWDTVEDAENYWDSFPMKMMRKRSAVDSLALTIHAR